MTSDILFLALALASSTIASLGNVRQVMQLIDTLTGQDRPNGPQSLLAGLPEMARRRYYRYSYRRYLALEEPFLGPELKDKKSSLLQTAIVTNPNGIGPIFDSRLFQTCIVR